MSGLVLASGSPTRAKLLHDAGLAFEVVVPQVDEATVKEALLAEGMAPGDIVNALAELKALRVSQSRPAELVIAADQVLAFAGALVNKSPNLEEARRLLRRLSGRKHELLTAAAIARAGSVVWRHLARAELRMRPMSEAFLEGYLARQGEDILGSVGCYRLEGEGAQLFSHVAGDYFGILGLPLLPLLSALRELGALSA